MDALFVIAVVMLLSGLAGGAVNSFIADPQTEKPLPVWKHMAIGVVTAYMVPLFLNMIAGDLIDKIRGVGGQPGDSSKLFVLAGFCLVAAVSSRAFMRSMSDRVLQDISLAKQKAEEAKRQASEVKDLIAPIVEDDHGAEPASHAEVAAASAGAQLTDPERAALHAITHGTKSFRSLAGLSEEARLDKEEAHRAVSSLVSRGLAAHGEGTNGRPRWYATSLGRIASSVLAAEQ
jgi:hypothetical protein